MSTINSWYSNNRLPRIDQAYEIARAFGVSLDYLVTGKEPEVKFDDPVKEEICGYIMGLGHEQLLEVKGVLKAMRYLGLSGGK